MFDVLFSWKKYHWFLNMNPFCMTWWWGMPINPRKYWPDLLLWMFTNLFIIEQYNYFPLVTFCWQSVTCRLITRHLVSTYSSPLWNFLSRIDFTSFLKSKLAVILYTMPTHNQKFKSFVSTSTVGRGGFYECNKH